MLLDFKFILPSLLMKIDIATMANSLEGRSPFLCKEMLEFAPTLNNGQKIQSGTTKHILRSIADDLLPSQLVNQPKRGFEIPLKNWVNTIFKERIHDLLLPNESYIKNYIRANFINNLILNKINIPSEKRAKILYKCLVTEIWHQSNQ